MRSLEEGSYDLIYLSVKKDKEIENFNGKYVFSANIRETPFIKDRRLSYKLWEDSQKTIEKFNKNKNKK